MNKLTLDDVMHLAKLSNLRISEEEANEYPAILTESLTYTQNLEDISTSDVPDTFFVTNITNVMEEDEINEDLVLLQEDVLKNAQKTKDGYFVVKRIL